MCKIKKKKINEIKITPPCQKREGNSHCDNGLMSWFTEARYGIGKATEMTVNVQHIKYLKRRNEEMEYKSKHNSTMSV